MIETRRLGFSLLARAVTMPGTAALMSEVASSGAHSLFIGGLPDEDWAGIDFGELTRRLKQEKNILVIGLRDERQQERLNPPDDLKVDVECQVIYLAERAILPVSPQPRRQSRD